MVKISIITVTLNSISGLQKTIESVVGQTYAEKEYIIIDGGSIDGSVDLINEYGSRISYWLSEPDSGIYAAMNKGIDLATGEWIIFMNSGDIFCDEKVIEDIFRNQTFKNEDVIYGNTIYKDSKKFLIAPSNISKGYFLLNTLCHQSIFTKRDSFKKLGSYNLQYKYISDREWLLRAKIASLKFYHVNETISVWDSAGFCSSNVPLVLNEVNSMWKKHFSVFEIIFYHLTYRTKKIIKRLL